MAELYFKEIPEFPDYEVSTTGVVRSKSRRLRYVHAVTNEEHFRMKEETILKQYTTIHGYFFVQPRKNGKPKNKPIHRLVAETFIPNPKRLPFVNHKDGNKKNNDISNLEWCTPKDNVNHAFKIGINFQGSRVKASILNEKCAIAIKNMISEGFSRSRIAGFFEVSIAVITYVSKGWKSAIPSTRDNFISKKKPSNVGVPVCRVDEQGTPIKYWPSASQAGLELKLDPAMILKVARGRFRQYKGHYFSLSTQSTQTKNAPNTRSKS